MNETDRHRLDNAIEVLGGNEERLKALIEQYLGTRDLDEADRRAEVVWEWRTEQRSQP